jgi:hypothetical protein
MIHRELVRSYRPACEVQDHPITCPSGPIRDPAAAAVPLLMRLLTSEPQEVVGALYVEHPPPGAGLAITRTRQPGRRCHHAA